MEQMTVKDIIKATGGVLNRGKRNSSLNLPYIAEEIARIKQVPYEMVLETTCQNAKKLYRL